ncbi:hypothetical protein M501DRAFT_991468 [Patellaria atrata CBS 101060]|uniref:GPI transamidase component PIG-S n=1 Tax=Patellaria atrata CBS 101060 TaxID=1346257 RepID=A0A9P4SD90_9PEZI|nr:hypothetical protein M501DRAFT_991468 [Patellaria atrata CBS 101060]
MPSNPPPSPAPSIQDATNIPPKSGAVDALNKAKQPPPESNETLWTRRLVILSFWAVVICLGIPIWWKTTTVYRAVLPLQAMMDWSDGKICRPVFPLQIFIDAPFLLPADAQNLIRTTQHALDDLNDFSAHHLRLLLSEPRSTSNFSQDIVQTTSIKGLGDETHDREDIALKINLIPGQSGSVPRSELQPYESRLDVFYTPNQIPSSSSTSSPLATFIANKLQFIFAEEQASLAYLLSQSNTGQQTQIKSMSQETAASLARQSTRSFKYAPTYHLTFSLFTPTSIPTEWDIEAALKEYMQPLLASLSSISEFTVDTQLQLYATFSPSVQQPEEDPTTGTWLLRKDDLSGFVNAAEWPLSPSIGKGPTVNFVLYVPTADQAPLVVKENRGNSWLVPQWGGVVILNPPYGEKTKTPSTLTKNDLQPAMLTFSNQLLSLLGLPQSPASLPLRISTLTRVRAASLLFSASSTLGALARLTQALESIAIPDTVAHSVDQTISRLHTACTDLREGRFHSALANARIAELEAEKAFFERSMVGQVYFPEEHKVAVYLPLLGPVSVPLIMAALKEVRKLRARAQAGA